MKKNPFPFFGILAMVGIGISMLQMFVKDISLIIAIMWGSTVIVAIIFVALYKIGYGERYRGSGGD
jgi:hypothetical protein